MERISVAPVFHDVRGKSWYSDQNAIRALNRMMDAQIWQQAVVPIHRLIATQAYVNADFRQAAEAASRKDDGMALPAVVQYDGRLYITDGHHRLFRDGHDGRYFASVRLFDLDAVLNPDPWLPAQAQLSFNTRERASQ